MKPPSHFTFLACLLFASAVSTMAADHWETTVDRVAPGIAAASRPVRLQYGFGWNGITAASGDVRLTSSGGRVQLDATGGTLGLARALWSYDVNHTSIVDAQTLRPLQVKEVEQIRSKHVQTELTFTPEGVTSVREEHRKGKTKSKNRKFDFPHVSSVTSALLYLRTQPLTDGAVHRVVVYPATSAYLCTVAAGSYDALRLDVQLRKIGKDRELLPYKKFKRATVWLSNDPERLVLRIEAQILVGTVFAELQSAQFENPKQ